MSKPPNKHPITSPSSHSPVWLLTTSFWWNDLATSRQLKANMIFILDPLCVAGKHWQRYVIRHDGAGLHLAAYTPWPLRCPTWEQWRHQTAAKYSVTTTNNVRRSQLPLYSFWKLKPKQNLLLGHGYLSYEKKMNLYRLWNPMDSSEGGIWKLHCTSRVTTQANESKQVSCLGTCREGCTWCHLRPLAPILEILVCQTTSVVTFWRTMRNPSKKPSSPFSSPFSSFPRSENLGKTVFAQKNMEKVFQGSTIKIKEAVPTSHQIGCTIWKQSGFRVSMRYNIHSLHKATNNPIWSNEITSLVATPNVIPWIRTDCWILLLPSDYLTWAIMDGSAKNPPHSIICSMTFK